jgi:hypothetical protein
LLKDRLDEFSLRGVNSRKKSSIHKGASQTSRRGTYLSNSNSANKLHQAIVPAGLQRVSKIAKRAEEK